jgi:hypothetical protein
MAQALRMLQQEAAERNGLMYLHQITMDTFVLLQATWPAGKAHQLVQRLEPTHVIVQRPDSADEYYLFTRRAALALLGRAGDETSVQDAFNLYRSPVTPTLDAYADAGAAPDRCVVVEEGRIIGFFDVDVPPEQWSRKRGGPVVTDKSLFKPGVGSAYEQVESYLEHAEPVPHSLVTDFPEQVPLNQTVSLLVSLAAEPGTRPSFPIALPTGATVDVVVQPQHGFVLEGSGEGSLVTSGETETLPLQFKLQATELGPGKIRVLAFHQGQPLGTMTLAPTVVPDTQATDRQRSTHGQRLASLSVRQPDLSLLILEHESGGKPAFTFRLTALDPDLGLNLKPFGPVQLRLDPLAYFQDFFKDIEDLPLRTSRDRMVAERRLAVKGAGLFTDLIPEDLQVLLWSLRERIQTVQVQSEEPWIPWELCKLQGKEDDQVVEGPFLCEAFAMTRWLPGIARIPTLRLSKMALVMPRDSELPFAPDERDYVLSLANGGRQVERITAGYLEVMEALAAGAYDAWHFTGHGGFRAPDPNRSAMVLENQEELTPQDMNGKVQNLGQAQPLVFLNACQIGRSAMSLTDIGGWAAQFLHAGAAAFIGAYWSVFDLPAYAFAQAVYDHLLAGAPIGKAVREARGAIKLSGDPTWLAYTVFADPLAMAA